MQYERLGVFYLGREVEPATGADTPEPLLYDSRDLTTHAVCVGMTGSGKTGLCIALLEEAGIDGIPAIAIDPKGDLGNLLLTFPELRAEDFAPWIDGGEAARKSMTPEAYARATAETWRKGLNEWQQDGARIGRLRDAAEIAVYTPGSDAGRPLSVMRSFSAPPAELRSDAGALRERIGATVSGLLGLVGIEADPIRSREHILLSTVLDRAWQAGRDLDLGEIIQAVQKPPFEKIGVLELETFYPAKDRLALATMLNNLLAAPGFAAWTQGDPLDVQKLLFTPQGKPRIAIVSIAHLDDAHRMFIVTLLLGEIVAWMRRQSGTASLRALLYMDEIFGYFPPTAQPPSKAPLLTLMKQARAYGLGVVLATQNPVDLDYKGLSNAGTWFIGRLQTERDKARVIEGLLGAAGEGLDKKQLESLLANLGQRVFLMRNVHDDAPILFRSRWALSYLRGPMTLQEISRVSPHARETPAAAGSAATDIEAETQTRQAEPAHAKPVQAHGRKPVVPAGIDELYLRGSSSTAQAPRVLGVAKLHFVDRRAGIDTWETRSWIAPLDEHAQRPDWAAVQPGRDPQAQFAAQPDGSRGYEDVPAVMLRPQSYRSWRKDLAAHLYEHATMTIFHCPAVGATVAPGDDEGDFRARLALALREKRDEEIDKLRRKYAPRLATLQNQMRRAEERIERERSQLSQQKMQTALSVGTSILGALLGRRALSASSVGRAGTAARQAGRIGKESEDVTRAEQGRDVLEQRLRDLQNELEQQMERLRTELDPATVEIQTIAIKPRKSDTVVETMALVWV